MSDQTIRNILSDATTLHWQFHAMEEKIEKLEAKNARLREALTHMVEWIQDKAAYEAKHFPHDPSPIELARAALSGEK